MTHLRVDVARASEASVVVPVGEIDLGSVGPLEEAIENGDGTDVVVDLRRVAFMDSVGLLTLLREAEAVSARGHAVRIVPGPPCVDRLFDLTDTRALFAFVDPSEIDIDEPASEIWLG